MHISIHEDVNGVTPQGVIIFPSTLVDLQNPSAAQEKPHALDVRLVQTELDMTLDVYS